MSTKELLRICDEAPSLNLLCVGDLMLDRFVYGKVDRISPEAPIPVLKHTHLLTMLGAAGNVARNVASLGARVTLAGVIGDDDEGQELLNCLAETPGITGNLSRSGSRRTTLKSRYIAGGQQLLRVDVEDNDPLTRDEDADLVETILASGENCHAILLSDYAKGGVTSSVIAACLRLSNNLSIPLIVDPKGTDFQRYGPVSLIKPNAKELSLVTGYPTSTDQEVEVALDYLLDTIEAQAVLVTRSEKGLSFKQRGEAVQHIPTTSREVYDVSGAGDTSLAALGIALASSADLQEASLFALSAAGIAVGKIGTAAVTNQEVQADIHRQSASRGTSRPEDDIYERIQRWKKEGLRVGFTNGCFDILHAGHLSVLEFAASRCDRLIVGLNADSSVRRLKGDTRPINSESDRATLLKGLKPVDGVILFEEDTPYNLIARVEPDVLVKGGDYSPETIVGADIVIARGGDVLIAPLLEGRSTTNIIEKSKS